MKSQSAAAPWNHSPVNSTLPILVSAVGFIRSQKWPGLSLLWVGFDHLPWPQWAIARKYWNRYIFQVEFWQGIIIGLDCRDSCATMCTFDHLCLFHMEMRTNIFLSVKFTATQMNLESCNREACLWFLLSMCRWHHLQPLFYFEIKQLIYK